MVVFNPATSAIAVIQGIWNGLLMAWNATIIAAMIMIVIDPDVWLSQVFLAIISVVTLIIVEFIARIQTVILAIILDGVVETIKLFPNIVISDVIGSVAQAFTGIAFTAITGFFLYQIIKNTFSHLGFDGEANLNTIIAYVIVIALLIFSNSIISTLLQITYDLSMIFIGSASNFGSAVRGSFLGLTRAGGRVSDIAGNIFILLLLKKIISSCIDLGVTVVQRMIVISILIMIGPLAIAFGVLKSMRNVTVTWIKSISMTAFAFLMYAVLIFFIANASSHILGSVNAGQYDSIVKLFIMGGLIMSITKIESLMSNIFMGQLTTGGAANMGITPPGVAGVVGGAFAKFRNVRRNNQARVASGRAQAQENNFRNEMRNALK